MSALFLSEEDVTQILEMSTAIDLVENAFTNLSNAMADNVPRVRVRATGIILHCMSASADYLGLVGWKNYTTTRSGANFLVGLHDQQTGRLVALIEADRLGQLRTGATTAIAAQRLAPPNANEMGLIGVGKQARTQLEALCAVRPIRRAYVYSRNEMNRRAFADEMSQKLSLEVIAVDRPQEAVSDLPIVVTATTSPKPVFQGIDLAEGTLVCAIGSNQLRHAEIDSDVFRRADNVVCDSVECCKLEAGDFGDALEKGILDWSRPVDLADVVTGKGVGRDNRDSIVVFKSVGMAIEDLALGAFVFNQAKTQDLGTLLPI